MEVMSSTSLEGEVNLSAVAAARTLACGEVFGGNEPVHTAIELSGLLFVGEIVPGPKGPAVWHVLKNRLLTRVTPSLRWPQRSVMSALI